MREGTTTLESLMRAPDESDLPTGCEIFRVGLAAAEGALVDQQGKVAAFSEFGDWSDKKWISPGPMGLLAAASRPTSSYAGARPV